MQMTETAWVFEYETLKIKEEKKADELGVIFKAVRQELINILGLNLMPMEDEDGKLRRAKENEYIPMSIMTAREGFVEAFIQRNEELTNVEKAEQQLEEEEKTGKSEMMSEDELDDFLQEDITFLDDPEELAKYAVRTSPDTQWINNNIVVPLETEAEIKKSKEEVPMKVSIKSESVNERIVPKSKRHVTVSSE